jgi:hypothetical protein
MVTEKINSYNDHLGSFATEDNGQFGFGYSFSMCGTCHGQGQNGLNALGEWASPAFQPLKSEDRANIAAL